MLTNLKLTSFTRKISWSTAKRLSCWTFISTPGRPNLNAALLRFIWPF